MNVVWASVLVSLTLYTSTTSVLEARTTITAKCSHPDSKDSSSPCSCDCKGRWNLRCNFKKQSDVVLTGEIFDSLTVGNECKSNTVYIQMKSAASLFVSPNFTDRWLGFPSAAFDIVNCDNVTLNSRPNATSKNPERNGYYAGFGIIDSNVSDLPAGFISNRNVSALRINGSRVGVIRSGFLFGVNEMRYIRIMRSEVSKVEGWVSDKGYIVLSENGYHSWEGFVLSNVTIGTLESNAFNFTHMNNVELFTVENSTLRNVKSGALSARGALQVTIARNTFQNLDKRAFKVKVNAAVSFVENTLSADGADVISEFECHGESNVQNNTLIVTTPIQPPSPLEAAVAGSRGVQSFLPFHQTCGKSQLFVIVTPKQRVIAIEDTRVTWILGCVLAVLVLAVVVGVAWVFRGRRPVLSMDRFLYFLSGRNHTKVSLENLPRNMELNTPRDEDEEDPEEGTSVKDLDMSLESAGEMLQHSGPCGSGGGSGEDSYAAHQSLDFSDENSSGNEQDF